MKKETRAFLGFNILFRLMCISNGNLERANASTQRIDVIDVAAFPCSISLSPFTVHKFCCIIWCWKATFRLPNEKKNDCVRVDF